MSRLRFTRLKCCRARELSSSARRTEPPYSPQRAGEVPSGRATRRLPRRSRARSGVTCEGSTESCLRCMGRPLTSACPAGAGGVVRAEKRSRRRSHHREWRSNSRREPVPALVALRRSRAEARHLRRQPRLRAVPTGVPVAILCGDERHSPPYLPHIRITPGTHELYSMSWTPHKRRLFEIPNKSTIADVSLVQPVPETPTMQRPCAA
jgi:hypothetical protein